MSPIKRVAMIVGSVALLSGLGGSWPAAAGGTGDAKPATLEATSQAFDEALRKDDAHTIFTYMTEDVVLMPPGEAPLRGKSAAFEWYSGLTSQYRTSSLVFTQREVFAANGVGAVVGAHEWILKPVAGGDPVVDRGSYMQIWKRQPDGRWLFAREIWNAAAPPAVQP